MRAVQGRMMVAVAAIVAAVGVTAACSSSSNSPSGSSTATSSTSDPSVLGAKKPATGSEVTIGLINGEGGQAGAQPSAGDAAIAAANYANDYLGGLAGHKIKVERCADTGDGASGVACANKFVQQRLPAVVIGEPVTAEKYYPIISGAGIPYVGSSPSSDLANKAAFFFSSGFVGELATQAVYAKDHGWKNVVILGAQTQELVGAVNAIGKPFFTKEGVNVKLVTLPLGTPDATAQVTAALQSKPDGILIFGDNTLCQSFLSALQTTGSTTPKFVNATCFLKSVLKSEGSSINNSLFVAHGDTSTDNAEGKLYNAIMAKYAPTTDTGGNTLTGYQSMLGFIRAVDSVGITGDVTASAIETAMKSATNVALPAGQGKTMSCTSSQFPSPAIAATVCNKWLFVTTYNNGTFGSYRAVDASRALG